MAGIFLKQSIRGHARSISLPARSHPTTLKIEEELNKLRNLELSSCTNFETSTLSIATHCLAEVYRSIGDLLKLPQTQQALTKHDDSSWVDELLEESIFFLDVCEKTRENLGLLRENMAKVQSSLRRRNNCGELDIDDDVTKYVAFLKHLKREMGKSLATLKQIIDNKLSNYSLMFNKVNNDQHVIGVVRVLRETSLICSFVFRSILGYFSSTPLEPKASKWSLVFKVVHNKGHGDNNGQNNALEDTEFSLNSLLVRKLCKENSRVMIQLASTKLQALNTRIEGLEKELECLFRQLIHIRVSLLNIISDN